MPVERIAFEVLLRDGPHRDTRLVLEGRQDTLLIADMPLADTRAIDPWDPPVPVAVYRLVAEYTDRDGGRQGLYAYTGRRHPRRRHTGHRARPTPSP